MSLLHIGVALCLSAAAAFLVTGATMRPIQPDCVAGSYSVRDEPACQPVQDSEDAAVPGKKNSGRRFR